MAAPSRILLIDDHPIILEGVKAILSRQKDLSICGYSEEGAAAVKLIQELKPDAVILDLMLKDTNGLEVLKDVRQAKISVPILVMSGNSEEVYAERALRAGANGYLMKSELADRLVSALRDILKEGIHVNPKTATRMLKAASAVPFDVPDPVLAQLTDRELEVLTLLGQGFSSRRIAERWNRSIKTVDTYREKIKVKLNLADAAELIRFAVQWVDRSGK